jgi:septum formation protein
MNKDHPELILASTSTIRAQLLRAAGVDFTALAPRVDEETIAAALLADSAPLRDIADALAEAKARKLSGQHPNALVLGCDQVLDLDGQMFSKPDTLETATAQLHRLQGKTHHLYSAAVLYQGGQPIWRNIGHARMTMRPLSALRIADYVAQNWDQIRHCVGCYQIEKAGVQLFSAIEGDTFTIQGLPLIALLNYFAVRGLIAT